MKEKKHPILEAERYLDNAREILSTKAGKDGPYYSDKKYVRMAGNTAWNGVLVALDAVLPVREKLKPKSRPSIETYEEEMSKCDSKMTRPLYNAYQLLHLHMGYDGVLDYKSVQSGLEKAKIMVDWAGKQYSRMQRTAVV
ncbi:MAG: DUF5618 family protein [Bacteroidales bacterium]|jgi:hypothetical protein|nr:DUF5618 family protein [Bacteroidales bacterium]